MRPRHSRLTLLCLVCVVGLGVAGCFGTAPDPDDSSERPLMESPEEEPSATEPTPIPGTVLSSENATARALAAEESYLTDRLRNASCLSDWGTEPTVVNSEATVVNRTADGVTVDVTHPYWYSTAADEVDASSNARYVVGPERTDRISGDVVAPCE